MRYGKLYRNGDYYSTNAVNPKSYENLLQGSKERNYKFTNKQRRTFISRVVYMEQHAENPLKTFILTFRGNPDKQPSYYVNKFFSNLRKNYKLHSYAYTLEIGEKGLFHYHVIVDSPYIKVQKLNSIWCKARGDFAPNAVRAFRKVKGGAKAAAYAAKYYSKIDKDKEKYKRDGIKCRLYATSNNLAGKECVEIESPEHYELLRNHNSFEFRTDYAVHGFVHTDVAHVITEEIQNEHTKKQ